MADVFPLLTLTTISKKRRQHIITNNKEITLNKSQHTLYMIWSDLVYYFEEGFVQQTLECDGSNFLLDKVDKDDKAYLLTKLTEVGWEYTLVKEILFEKHVWKSLTVRF